jgi:hypothetical protein
VYLDSSSTHADHEACLVDYMIMQIMRHGWLQRLCSGIGLVQQDVRIDCDSPSAIFLAKNSTYHSKTKHIDIQYNFLRDMVEERKYC